MDPEANSVLDTSSGDAATNTTPVASNDNSPSSEPRLVSQGPKYKSKNWEGIEEQIALDSFLSGESERPLMELLSSSEGLDVNKAHLRSTPFYAAALEDGSELTFLGAVDSHVDLETRYKFTNYEGPIEKEILQQMPPDGKATVSEDVTPLKLAETRMASSILKEPEDHLDNESYEGPHESFKYNSLPTNSKMFRLVCSGAQHEEGVISSLEMHTFDIDAPPTFHALSYVWNSPQRDVSMTCNGQKLMVTESLALALK